MIGVTLFGLIFTPVFYVVIRKLTWQEAGRIAAERGAGRRQHAAGGGMTGVILAACQPEV